MTLPPPVNKAWFIVTAAVMLVLLIVVGFLIDREPDDKKITPPSSGSGKNNSIPSPRKDSTIAVKVIMGEAKVSINGKEVGMVSDEALEIPWKSGELIHLKLESDGKVIEDTFTVSPGINTCTYDSKEFKDNK